MCYFNDLQIVALQAYRGQTILAQWIVRVYPTAYKLEEPLPKPADFVLRSARFQVVVERGTGSTSTRASCAARGTHPRRGLTTSSPAPSLLFPGQGITASSLPAITATPCFPGMPAASL